MKKVLIISYFYPPCELTAGRRVESWAKGLAEKGYEIHVVTRKWENEVKSFQDIHQGTSLGIKRIKQDGYHISFVPYKPNLRDRLLNSGKFVILRKLLSIKESLLQNLFLKQCPYSNMYDESCAIIEEKKIDLIIISGNPFIQFKFGHKLNKKYKTPWIADYRDAWTTSTINQIGRSIWFSLYKKYERKFEIKWVSTATLVTASSEEIGSSISKITGVHSVPVYNGFRKNLFDEFKGVQKVQAYFQIAYIGTLYDGQDISIFLNGFKSFIKSKKPKVRLLFPGLLALPEQMIRLRSLISGIEEYVEFSDRVPHDEILKIEKESHVLLHVAWSGQKGIIASKIYEYIGSGTPIIVAPGDQSDIDKIVQRSEQGSICNTQEECAAVLEQYYERFLLHDSISLTKDTSNPIFEFTREAQVDQLDKEMQKIFIT